jgi:hypothetical protein
MIFYVNINAGEYRLYYSTANGLKNYLVFNNMEECDEAYHAFTSFIRGL